MPHKAQVHDPRHLCIQVDLNRKVMQPASDEGYLY